MHLHFRNLTHRLGRERRFSLALVSFVFILAISSKVKLASTHVRNLLKSYETRGGLAVAVEEKAVAVANHPTTDSDVRWLLFESPLREELKIILDARDKWWTARNREMMEKKEEELQKMRSSFHAQISALRTAVDELRAKAERFHGEEADTSPANPGVNFNRNLLMSPYNESFRKAMGRITPFITSAEQVLRYQLQHQLDVSQPITYFITPTIYRNSQMADLTRLGQTLLLDSGTIYWILIEDADHCTRRLRNFLARLGMPFAHGFRKTAFVSNKKLPPRGVAQRNYALQITKQIGIPGVIYFGDDDNAYDLRLFAQLRLTQRIGILPVGFRGGGHYERCIVDPTTGKVVSIAEKVHTKRKFPMDMAGLVYHTSIIWSKNPTFSSSWSNGQQETKFLEQLIDHVTELEPLAYNCTHFFVWHLKTEEPKGPFKVWADQEYDVLHYMV